LLYLISLAFALYFLYKAILFDKKSTRLMPRKMFRLARWTLAGIYTSALLGSLRII
ncbi:protoheme IX farnesyltransferase, partial [Candidatus Bathyarchaeota archaeon]